MRWNHRKFQIIILGLRRVCYAVDVVLWLRGCVWSHVCADVCGAMCVPTCLLRGGRGTLAARLRLEPCVCRRVWSHVCADVFVTRWTWYSGCAAASGAMCVPTCVEPCVCRRVCYAVDVVLWLRGCVWSHVCADDRQCTPHCTPIQHKLTEYSLTLPAHNFHMIQQTVTRKCL